jgi:N-acetylglucosaminyl-diphospho-decaprenol L-rhamnosyltransferase
LLFINILIDVINNITVIIVSYKSRKTILNCLKSLNQFKKILILDNSNDKKLKDFLKKKSPRIKIFLSNKNNGYGAGYNFLINKVKTQFALIMTPDTSIRKGSLKKYIKSLSDIKNKFCLMGPYSQNRNFILENKKEISQAKLILGFSMLINLNQVKKKNFFDENFFLYMEDIDLCKRCLNQNKDILINKSFVVDHIGAKSSDLNKILFMKLRNWHWMWSQYFYFKKYNGAFLAFIYFLPKLINSSIKFLFFYIFRSENYVKYEFRVKGLFSSMIGKKSSLRPENLI